MDELLTLGCIALFFALVVVPILAIIALAPAARLFVLSWRPCVAGWRCLSSAV